MLHDKGRLKVQRRIQGGVQGVRAPAPLIWQSDTKDRSWAVTQKTDRCVFLNSRSQILVPVECL